ncbi:hypothetical protein P5673_018591 [Acropora cervicornis]|uniref:CCHC-type domain-containing protein n=1 Tax=Acropora cervicornis TaxID=6130 RepID=A0AAD9V2M2_ACRCE|nr:hypothetical protein P5673_018591 [Acropora cervicornis]
MASSILPGRPNLFPGVDTSLPVEEFRVRKYKLQDAYGETNNIFLSKRSKPCRGGRHLCKQLRVNSSGILIKLATHIKILRVRVHYPYPFTDFGLEDREQHQELAGVSALYIALQQALPGSLLIAYQEWLHRKPRKDGLFKQVVYRMDVEERKKGAVHNVTREPTPKCVVCHGPHQVTSCKNWGKNSIANRCEISKKNELCYRCLRSGHQGKNCPENNGCGINDCKGTHHFHVHFECRYKPPERVDACRNAKRLWRL